MPNCDLSGPGPLQKRLNSCPILRDSIVWEESDTGQKVPYTQWDSKKKTILNRLFQRLISHGEKAPLAELIPPDPQKNVNTYINPYNLSVYLTYGEAFSVYAAHVAWALYLEAKKLLPWSLTTMSEGERSEILASDRYHARIRPSQNSDFYPPHIEPGKSFQPTFEEQENGVLRSDPRIGYWFLTGLSPVHPFQKQNLLGASIEETLANLTAWFNVNVGHGSRLTKPAMFQKVFLKERLMPDVENDGNPDRLLIDSPAGCHTTASLFHDLARSVNIPLLHVKTMEDYHCGGADYSNLIHGGLIYRWEHGDNARILWHTDEIYADNHGTFFPISEQNAKVPGKEISPRLFEAYWVLPSELEKWGFHYELTSMNPKLAQKQLMAQSPSPYEDFYGYGYLAGYWLRSDRATNKYGNDAYIPGDVGWRVDLANLFRLERLYQLCGWKLIGYHLGAPWTYDVAAAWKDGIRTNVGWVRPDSEYAARSQACAKAYGGAQVVIDTAKDWDKSRGYLKSEVP